MCGELIGLKEVRCGIEVDEKGWGIITRWQHLACTRLPKCVVSAEAIEDFDTLLPPDAQRVREMVAATDAPSHLREINPDEEIEASAAPRGPLWARS